MILSELQDLDGACIQSVNLVVDEDPRTEMTLSHMGEVFMAGQYRISLPYYDGKLLLCYLALDRTYFSCHGCDGLNGSFAIEPSFSKD